MTTGIEVKTLATIHVRTPEGTISLTSVNGGIAAGNCDGDVDEKVHEAALSAIEQINRAISGYPEDNNGKEPSL